MPIAQRVASSLAAYEFSKLFENSVVTLGDTDRPTPRELEVLGLVADGLKHREVGQRLSIAETTVDGYVQTLKDKLHCRTQAELVAKAQRLGLLPVNDKRPTARTNEQAARDVFGGAARLIQSASWRPADHSRESGPSRMPSAPPSRCRRFRLKYSLN